MVWNSSVGVRVLRVVIYHHDFMLVLFVSVLIRYPRSVSCTAIPLFFANENTTPSELR